MRYYNFRYYIFNALKLKRSEKLNFYNPSYSQNNLLSLPLLLGLLLLLLIITAIYTMNYDTFNNK